MNQQKAIFKVTPYPTQIVYELELPSDVIFLEFSYDIFGVNFTFVGTFEKDMPTVSFKFYFFGKDTKPDLKAGLTYIGHYYSEKLDIHLDVWGEKPLHKNINQDTPNISKESA